MNFPIKSHKKWHPLPIFVSLAVFMMLAALGVYGLTADEPVMQENPAEEAFAFGSLLKNSIARRDTDQALPSPEAPDKIVPKAVSPANTVPFALPDDYMPEEISEVEYPPLDSPVRRNVASGVEDIFVAARDLEEASPEDILPVAATPTVLNDLDKLAEIGEMESVDIPAEEPQQGLFPELLSEPEPGILPLKSVVLENPHSAPPKIVETEVAQPAAVKVPRLKKRTSANAKVLRSRPTFGADPYQARPYYTPYVPTTGPGVLVTPR